MDTVVKLICNPEDYDLGLDLMWAEGIDYDEVMKAVGQALPWLGLSGELRKHRAAIEMDYVRWAGAIHPEGLAASAHKIQALQNLGYN